MGKSGGRFPAPACSLGSSGADLCLVKTGVECACCGVLERCSSYGSPEEEGGGDPILAYGDIKGLFGEDLTIVGGGGCCDWGWVRSSSPSMPFSRQSCRRNRKRLRFVGGGPLPEVLLELVLPSEPGGSPLPADMARRLKLLLEEVVGTVSVDPDDCGGPDASS